MDLVTIRLDDLGQDCIVKNDNGDEFLVLSKVRQAKRGFKDKWELTVCVQGQRELTATGKRKLSVFDAQTEDERVAKAARKYIGSGIRLYEDAMEFVPNATPATSTLPSNPLPY